MIYKQSSGTAGDMLFFCIELLLQYIRLINVSDSESDVWLNIPLSTISCQTSLLLSPAFLFLAIIKAFCPFPLKSGLLPFYSLIARTSRTTSSNLFLTDKEAFSFSKFNYFYSDWEWFIVEASWWDTQSVFGVFLRNTQCPASSKINNNNKKKNTNQASLERQLQ